LIRAAAQPGAPRRRRAATHRRWHWSTRCTVGAGLPNSAYTDGRVVRVTRWRVRQFRSFWSTTHLCTALGDDAGPL